ncbi:hypothetical protein B566_EDAN008008, partial [Ephemera danica]
MEVECEGFTFTSKFDGANLAQVEYVPKNKSASGGKATPGAPDVPDYEFNLWTKPDCAGTEFENGNRTWFYFGIKGGPPFALVKLNIVNLNRQAKLFTEGMSPVYKIIPGKPNWDRIHDKPTFNMEQKRFVLSFKYRTLENLRATTYFAFTYPHSYQDLQHSLHVIDMKGEGFKKQYEDTKEVNTIYYHRECVCWSLEQRRVDLLTVSSYHGICSETEPRLKHLFPETNVPRCCNFTGKKIVFVSARVHPGETPSSFVLNGMLNFILQPHDPVAQLLRKLFVFKFIPSLNPDGMAKGHYRTDTRGVNLNRVYLNPSLVLHPSIYAARSLIRYYHYGCEMVDEESLWESLPCTTSDSPSPELPRVTDIKSKVSVLSLADSESSSSSSADAVTSAKPVTPDQPSSASTEESGTERPNTPETSNSEPLESGIFIYLDLHGHASKKGVFMYGNHFENIEDSIECMLLPKIMSLNNTNFHFTSCNFTKRNMYLRVAVLKATGLVRSYTLECNYNTGRLVNTLPPNTKDNNSKPSIGPVVPPKYTPQIFEEVGRALAVSVLDLAGANPWSRVRSSEMRNVPGIREWLRRYIQVEQTAAASRPAPQRRTSVQVTSAGGSVVAGPSSLPGALESAPTRARLKTHHLAPLTKARSDPCEDSEKKENLATSSLSLEPTVKLKSPMSPRENLAPLPSPRFSKTKPNPLQTNKASTVQTNDSSGSSSKALSTTASNGRVTKVRKVPEKLLNKQILTGAVVSGETELKKIGRSLSIDKDSKSEAEITDSDHHPMWSSEVGTTSWKILPDTDLAAGSSCSTSKLLVAQEAGSSKQ